MPLTPLFQRLTLPPPAGLSEKLPEFFHVPLQQVALRQIVEPERALTPGENEKWAEHILLTYILGRRGDPVGDATPRLLTPHLVHYLNGTNEAEEDLPATRFIKLLCARISPFDRIADLRNREGRLRFYLDFAVLHNLNFRLPPELLPDFIWRALAGENPHLPKPAKAAFPLSYGLAHFWRKALPQIPFQPEDEKARALFLAEFSKIHAAHALDERIIPPELKKAFAQVTRTAKPNSLYVSSAPAAAPVAKEPRVNLWHWDDAQTLPPYVSQRLEATLKASGVSYASFHSSQKEKPPAGAINLFACAPDHLADFMLRGGLPFFENRRNIGWCFWETSQLPKAYHIGLNLLDEIWVPSAAQQKLFSAADKSVEILPLPINLAPPAAHITRAGLGVEKDAFLFLQVFDAADSLSRKNLVGTAEAFQHAFAKNENVLLLIKMRGHQRNLSAREEGIWARLKRRTEKDTRIILLHEEFSDAEQTALLSLSDAVISLHRASAFGATLLEATARGVPIIVSNCGAAVEMLPESAVTKVPVVPASVVFDVSVALDREMGHRWHDPDLAEAAKAMLHLYKQGRKKNVMLTLPFDAASCGKKIAARLKALEGA